jgi:nucleoside-diphosphate-sugar epimerase
VTGATGQLGQEVVRQLKDRGCLVTALDLRETDAPVERVVVGNASDAEVVRDAVDGIDGIIHLAALRTPTLGTPEQVFCGNTSATFNVLEQGAQAGVRQAVIASSYSILGLPYATRVRHPAYLPIDEHTPGQVEDPYGLSKQVDELIAAMMWWRHGLSVVALRFPFLGGIDEGLLERADRITKNPASAASELWTYLETRDAAAACVAGLTQPDPGFHAIAVAAPTTLAPYPTTQLLDAYHPNVPRRTVFEGRTAPVDLRKARSLLGWSPEYVWITQMRDLDDGILGRSESTPT